jgi:hypothetical protein
MKRLVEQLVDRAITEVIAGGSNGSIVLLEVDFKFLLSIYCAWRLEGEGKILTGWNDSNDPVSGQLTIEIKKLAGDKIEHVSISEFNDLTISFSSGKVLNVFCDITSHIYSEALDENWCLCDMESNFCLIVNKDQEIIEQPYKTTS